MDKILGFFETKATSFGFHKKAFCALVKCRDTFEEICAFDQTTGW